MNPIDEIVGKNVREKRVLRVLSQEELDGVVNDSLTVLDQVDLLVRPRINPVLSPYFEKLTGIASDRARLAWIYSTAG